MMAETFTPEQWAAINGKLSDLTDRITLLEDRMLTGEQRAVDADDYLDTVAVHLGELEDECHGRGLCPSCVERDAIVKQALSDGVRARMRNAGTLPGDQPDGEDRHAPALATG
jgi:hypothetical protein